MVTPSMPPLPWFLFTFSQASSKFFRLYTLSISEWTFLFLPRLSLSDAREERLSLVSSVQVSGLSRMELSNLPLPTHQFPASPHSQQSTGPSPSDGPFERAGAAAPVCRQRSEAFCFDLVPEYYSPIRFLAPLRPELHPQAYIRTYRPGGFRPMFVFPVFPPFRLRVSQYLDHTFRPDDTRPPWVTHASSPPCRPQTPWYPDFDTSEDRKIGFSTG